MNSKPDFSFENKYLEQYNTIAGIDEAGRGPLAGPVAAGAVIFHKQFEIEGLNDSKKLTPKKRDDLFEKITTDDRISFGTGLISPEEIDEINILNAAFKAMHTAADNLTEKPDFLLIDGNRFYTGRYEYKTIIKGDSKSTSIAAASVIAKVYRDRIMLEYAEKYPQYEFASNKGYGTKRHFEAIKKYGKTPIHRNSFLRKFEAEQKKLFE